MDLQQKAKQEAFDIMQKMGLAPLEYDGRETLPKEIAIQCAFVAIDLLIKEQTMHQNGETNPVLYWQMVKTELEILEKTTL